MKLEKIIKNINLLKKYNNNIFCDIKIRFDDAGSIIGLVNNNFKLTMVGKKTYIESLNYSLTLEAKNYLAGLFKNNYRYF